MHINGNKSIKYYSPESTKVLYFRNYKILLDTDKETSPSLMEGIEVEAEPNILCEGELGDTQRPIGPEETKPKTRLVYQHETREEETLDEESMHLRKCPRVDYRQLNELAFLDEGEVTYLTSAEMIYAMFAQALLVRDDPKILCEPKENPEWPDWEKAVSAELEQLASMHTWELIDCPDGVVPIANK